MMNTSTIKFLLSVLAMAFLFSCAAEAKTLRPVVVHITPNAPPIIQLLPVTKQ